MIISLLVWVGQSNIFVCRAKLLLVRKLCTPKTRCDMLIEINCPEIYIYYLFEQIFPGAQYKIRKDKNQSV